MVGRRSAAAIVWLVVTVALAFSACMDKRRDGPPAERRCTACHGSDERVGDELTRAAPPRDLDGNTEPSSPGVGAHAIHLLETATHAPVACNECHLVPESTFSPGHVDTRGPAEVTFGTMAKSGGRAPLYDGTTRTCTNTYCHAAESGSFTAPRTSEQACGSCHGLPPPLPHPQTNDCARCHGEVVDAVGKFRNPALHVDGKVQVTLACNSCHGAGTEGGPPPDLAGNTDVRARGVGAHAIHLAPSERHGGIVCSTCHTVPSAVGDPSHLDDSPGAEVVFGGIAANGGHAPLYSTSTASCSGTYCHRSAIPVWNTPRAEAARCGTCHGLPPTAPHPASDRCSDCHGTVIDAARRFIAPARHVDGIVDLSDAPCATCHGQGPLGAPPPDLLGATSPTAPGVGAHARHLGESNSHAVVACSECHLVPATVNSPGHVDTPRPAEVVLGSLATLGSRAAHYDAGTRTCSGTYCHGGAIPMWQAPRGAQEACGSCHGLPPPAPHPEGNDCSRCHGGVIAADRTFVAPARHVNGTVDVELGCSSCHGSSSSPAPPTDLAGDTSKSARGVGAHAAHLGGGQLSRPLACNECHRVPAAIDTPGHIDDLGRAEVALSGVALAAGSSPTYDYGTLTCGGTYCHGPRSAEPSVSPPWTRTSGPLPCTSCHGLPPPLPHPQILQCNLCHQNVTEAFEMIDRSLHVNGRVDF